MMEVPEILSMGLTVLQSAHVFDSRYTIWTDGFKDLLSSSLQNVGIYGEKV